MTTRTPRAWPGPSEQVQAWNDLLARFTDPGRNTTTLSVPLEDAVYPALGHAHVGTLGAAVADYILGATSVVTTGATAFAINVLRAVPFVLDHGQEIKTLAFSVTASAVGSAARVGIYGCVSDQAGNLYPGALLRDAGEIATTSNGFKSATVNLQLAPHRVYWAVYNAGTLAPTIRHVPIVNLSGMLGIVQANAPNATSYLSVASAYGALPTTFPTGAAEQTGVAPAVFAQFAAGVQTTGTQRRVVGLPTYADAYFLRRVRIVKSAALSRTSSSARGVAVKALLTTGGAARTDELVGSWDSADSALLASSPKTISPGEAINRPIAPGQTLQVETTYRGWQPLSMRDAAVLFEIGVI